MSNLERHSEVEEKPKFGRTVLEDIRRGDFQVTMKRDWDDVIELYDIPQAALNRMGAFKRDEADE